jgi:hypothetical protein
MLLRCLGFWYFDPSLVTAKLIIPKSIPIAFPLLLDEGFLLQYRLVMRRNNGYRKS